LNILILVKLLYNLIRRIIMKKLLLIALMLVSIDILFSQDYSDWKWMHEKPQGNTLRWIKMWDANNWYVIGYSGTFMKTTNAGVNWYFHHKAGYPRPDGSTDWLYCAWFFNQNTGLVAGSNGAVLRTTNAGVTFDTIAGFSSSGTIYNLQFMNANTGYFAGTSSVKVYRTLNGGLNWTQIPGLGSITAYDVYAADTNNVIVASTSGNVYKTTNAGLNWATINTGSTSALYDMHFVSPDTGFVCGSAGAFSYTVNGGLNWTPAPISGSPTSYNMRVVSTQEIYVWQNGAFKTTNMGANWTIIANNSTNQTWSSTIYMGDIFASTMAIVGAFGQMNKSTNSGATWTSISLWISQSTLYDVYANYNDGKVWVAGALGAPQDQILYSTNGGANWSLQPSNSSATIRSIRFLNSTTGYYCGTNGNIRKTTNGGANWDSLPFPSTTITLYRLAFVNNMTGYVFGSSGNVWGTTNGGLNWTQSSTGVSSTLESGDFVDANTGWLAGASGTVYKTTNAGLNWSQQNANTATTIYELRMINANSGYLCGSSGLVRRTTNGGTNWDTVFIPYSTTMFGMSFYDFNNGMIGGSGGYVIKTSTAGQNWTITNTGGSTVNGIYMTHPDSAWTAEALGGTHKYTRTLTGIITWEHQIPSNYTLYQNYPNPFNPNTKIVFGLHKAGNVDLKIYDITGREVKKLLSNQNLNPGTVTYEFNGTELSSGVYFYSLIVNGIKIDTKKMVLVK
jgi:photosystem II stability/assembly factor-like uncharacterized protein